MNKKNSDGVAKMINEKMRCLDDFGICDKHDDAMKSKLYRVISDNPNKDPQQVIDYYCRPLIQAKVNSWN